jgi:hypothetical protein
LIFLRHCSLDGVVIAAVAQSASAEVPIGTDIHMVSPLPGSPLPAHTPAEAFQDLCLNDRDDKSVAAAAALQEMEVISSSSDSDDKAIAAAAALQEMDDVSSSSDGDDKAIAAAAALEGMEDSSSSSDGDNELMAGSSSRGPWTAADFVSVGEPEDHLEESS